MRGLLHPPWPTVAPMPRPKSYPADLRDRLIHAAAESLTHGDPEELSLRTLAASEGTSTNAIYTLFGGKEQLIAAVAQEAVRSFSEAQRTAAMAAAAERGDVLMALGMAYRAWALEHPALYRMMFGRPHPTPTADDVDGLAPLAQVIEQLMDAGVVPHGPAGDISRALWASVHGWVTLETNGMFKPDADAFARYLQRLHVAQGLVPKD